MPLKIIKETKILDISNENYIINNQLEFLFDFIELPHNQNLIMYYNKISNSFRWFIKNKDKKIDDNLNKRNIKDEINDKINVKDENKKRKMENEANSNETDGWVESEERNNSNLRQYLKNFLYLDRAYLLMDLQGRLQLYLSGKIRDKKNEFKVARAISSTYGKRWEIFEIISPDESAWQLSGYPIILENGDHIGKLILPIWDRNTHRSLLYETFNGGKDWGASLYLEPEIPDEIYDLEEKELMEKLHHYFSGDLIIHETDINQLIGFCRMGPDNQIHPIQSTDVAATWYIDKTSIPIAFHKYSQFDWVEYRKRIIKSTKKGKKSKVIKDVHHLIFGYIKKTESSDNEDYTPTLIGLNNELNSSKKLFEWKKPDLKKINIKKSKKNQIKEKKNKTGQILSLIYEKFSSNRENAFYLSSSFPARMIFKPKERILNLLLISNESLVYVQLKI